eukprot:TRINITY_DN563_c0_g4_i1.p1 TRINITY_DN563_c0_g4~~TRINITY_DN563_c0_g4_i1.p1  ORF type:complete len:1300 (-),score=225.13 TRINITY_DN563_c0_g4_i1:675-4049(-)
MGLWLCNPFYGDVDDNRTICMQWLRVGNVPGILTPMTASLKPSASSLREAFLTPGYPMGNILITTAANHTALGLPPAPDDESNCFSPGDCESSTDGWSRHHLAFVDKSLTPLPNGTCPFPAGLFYDSDPPGACTGRQALSVNACPMTGGKSAEHFCPLGWHLHAGDVGYHWSTMGILSYLTIQTRIVDPVMSPRDVSAGTRTLSTASHNQGRGLAQLPGGNPFANCSAAAPCVTARGVRVVSPLYDDTLGQIGVQAPTITLASTFRRVANDVSVSLRRSMAQAASDVARDVVNDAVTDTATALAAIDTTVRREAVTGRVGGDSRQSASSTGASLASIYVGEVFTKELERRGLLNESTRMVVMDAGGVIGVPSHGSAVVEFYPFATRRRLVDSEDPVIAAMCGALTAGMKAAASSARAGAQRTRRVGVQASDLVPAGVPCAETFPMSLPNDVSFVTTEFAVASTGGVESCGNGTDTGCQWWILLAAPVMLHAAVCHPDHPGCDVGMWALSAVPWYDIYFAADALSADLTVQSAALAQTLEGDASRASDEARVVTIIAVIVVVIVVVAVGSAMFAAVVRPLRVIADTIAAAATLDIDVLHDALQHLGAVVPSLHPDVEASATPASAQIGRDLRADLLVAFASATRRGLWVSDVARLQGAFATMAYTMASLGKYVPHEIVSRFAASDKVVALGMMPADLVVMFSDIADFTAISERTPPRTLLAVVSEYFAVMSDCVGVTDGAIDKFIGDAVMATWGAVSRHESPALAAVVCAVNMHGCIKAHRERWLQFRVRIGLHAGKAMVGNIGSPQRFNFTVLGDVVNVASRLEGLNKVFGTGIIISDAVADRLEGPREESLLPGAVADSATVLPRVHLQIRAKPGQVVPVGPATPGSGVAPPSFPVVAPSTPSRVVTGAVRRHFVLRLLGTARLKGRREPLPVYDIPAASLILARATAGADPEDPLAPEMKSVTSAVSPEAQSTYGRSLHGTPSPVRSFDHSFGHSLGDLQRPGTAQSAFRSRHSLVSVESHAHRRTHILAPVMLTVRNVIDGAARRALTDAERTAAELVSTAVAAYHKHDLDLASTQLALARDLPVVAPPDECVITVLEAAVERARDVPADAFNPNIDQLTK